ncbi:GmrSD restriction endonuclease domain-containing protein [Blastococcus litoris]|uniref:GmrSD restriction endonuclease domain-containing protein n=1 Tax=Blastococcus litoris TaxID=2171622 RepID=UPI001F14298A|nr:DUF1524 domain-containing protein [Blastococcus litoris]
MAAGPSVHTRLGILAAVAVVFIAGGIGSNGAAGGLLMAGLIALVVGGAALRGRMQWALAGRTVAGAVAAAGLAAAVVGGALMPETPTAPAASESTPAPATTSSTPTPSEADLEAAEAALADAETAESAAQVDALAGAGLLTDTAAQAAVENAGRTTALAALAAVEVKGRAPRTGYDRDNFGSGWVDTDRNGCDTRNDVLARDLEGETFKPGTRNCVVLTGNLADPYSGRAIAFQRGQSTSDDVQIDHVVALSDAWQKGAQALTAGQRTAFANDPLNLLAVDGPLNMQKGDGDAASWLPPNRGYRCAYVARQVAVKVSYGLWMTQAEKNAIATVLSACPGEPLPGGVVAQVPEPVQPTPTPAPAPAPAPKPAPAPAPVPAPAPAPAPAPPVGVSYKNCDAVRAAGAAPIRAGQPGYAPHLDRDGDGVGCE